MRDDCQLVELQCERFLKTFNLLWKYFRSFKKYTKQSSLKPICLSRQFWITKNQLFIQLIFLLKGYMLNLVLMRGKIMAFNLHSQMNPSQKFFLFKCRDRYAIIFQIHTQMHCACIFNYVFLYKTCFLSYRLNHQLKCPFWPHLKS